MANEMKCENYRFDNEHLRRRTAGLILMISFTLGDGAVNISSTGPQQKPVSQGNDYIYPRYTFFNAETAFFLKKSRQDAIEDASLQTLSQPVLFLGTTKAHYGVNVSYGPFSAGQTISSDLLDMQSDVSFIVRTNWKIHAFVTEDTIFSDKAKIQVLFYISERDWDDGEDVKKLPCIVLHAFLDVHEARTVCSLGNNLGMCLAEMSLPYFWNELSGNDKHPHSNHMSAGKTVELYYSLQSSNDALNCTQGSHDKATVARPIKDGMSNIKQGLNWVSNVTLKKALARMNTREVLLDGDISISLPIKPLRPQEIIHVPVKLLKKSTVNHFTLRMKVKKGVTLLSVVSASPNQWGVTSDIVAGTKHAVATVTLRKMRGASSSSSGSGGESALEIARFLFEMDNVTSLSVTRRILWQVDYDNRGPIPDQDRIITELTVTQRDITAIKIIPKSHELVNTAVLTGRPVNIPLRVIMLEANGTLSDVTQRSHCQSEDEHVIKVSSACQSAYVQGNESRGSVRARLQVSYEHLRTSLDLTVWLPKLPLHIELSDGQLSPIKNWRVPILYDKREGKGNEDSELKIKGCTLQVQHALLHVWTQLCASGHNGTDQITTLLGPEWFMDVTELVKRQIEAEDTKVVHLRGGTVVIGQETGTTNLKVISPVSGGVLGERAVTVSEEKVSVSGLHVTLLSGLSLSLRPSSSEPGVIVASTTAQHGLHSLKQEAALSLWVEYSDGTMAPLNVYHPNDYTLAVNSLDVQIASIDQDQQSPWPVVIAEGEGNGRLLKVKLNIRSVCQKNKRKMTLMLSQAFVRVRFGGDIQDIEESPEDVNENDSAIDMLPSEQDNDYEVETDTDEITTVGYTDRSHRGLQIITTDDLDTGQNAADEELEAVTPAMNKNGARPKLSSTVGPDSGDQSNEREIHVNTAHKGMSDLQIGMYTLLGVFSLAVVLFLINCAKLFCKRKCQERQPSQEEEVNTSQEWVSLGTCKRTTKKETLFSLGYRQASVVDSGQGYSQIEGSSSQASDVNYQNREYRSCKHKDDQMIPYHGDVPLNSPTTERKRVTFSTFTVAEADDNSITYNFPL
ncbi:transmembrane protein 132E-like [Lampetra fluviatilis]